MKLAPFVLMRRGATLACCIGAFVLLAPGAARGAGMQALHDFSLTGPYGKGDTRLVPYGNCSACHVPHNSYPDSLLSPRTVKETFYNQYKLKVPPNYLPGTTILCYDCHDDAVTADAIPDPSVWLNTAHKPQDIALGGTQTGFYEMVNGTLPATPFPTNGAPTAGHYWKTEPSGTPDWQQGDKIPCRLCHDPHVTTARLAGNEAFFLKETRDGTASGVVTLGSPPMKASTYDSVTNPDGSRSGSGTGRRMCAACHGYAPPNNITPPVRLYGVDVPYPPNSPTAVPEHLKPASEDDPAATPCIECHPHNRPAGCNECHGYPPLKSGVTFNRLTEPDGESYSGGAGAHRRHMDALGPDFKCELCHGPRPGRLVQELPNTTWHIESSGNSNGMTVVRGNVDIRGQVAYWGEGSSQSYNGTSTGGSSGVYAFAAKGGPDGANGGRCSNLICHGMPPNTAGALNWTDKLVDDGTGNPYNGADSLANCKWCHDKTPARIGSGPWAPNVLGNSDGAAGDWTTGNTWGADVNGHGKATGNYDDNALNDGAGNGAANKTCTFCHDARYTTNALPATNTPLKVHFNGSYESSNSQKRLRDTINGLAIDQSTPAAAADAACVVCHQNGASGTAVEGTDVANHENTAVNGYVPIESQFTRVCRQCHDVHGSNWNGATRNLRMVGKWLDNPSVGTRGTADSGDVAYVDSSDSGATPPTDITTADLRVTFTANTGAGSYDAGNNEGFSPPRSVCVVCHVNLVNGHSQVGDSVARGVGHLPVGTDCTQCHEHGKAFKPSGCFSCHGTSLTETPAGAEGTDWFRKQFWPDGNPGLHLSAPQYDYADDQSGDHLKHVTAIAAKIFGETPAQLVNDSTAQNPTLTSFVKQVEICWFCHSDPGGNPGGLPHLNNDATAPSGSSRVDVLQSTGPRDYFGKFKTATGDYLTYGRANYTRSTKATEPMPTGGDITGGRYGNGTDFTNGSCANLVCHNQTATPTAASVPPGTWNAPPTWTPANAACSNIACHATATYTIAHNTHVNGAPKSYACTECHPDNATTVPVTNPIPLAHGDGEVDMKWDNAGSLEGTHGGNGYYDKNNNGANDPAPGDTGFGYKSGGATAADPSYARGCNRVYCHGGDNNATYAPNWGGITTSPSSLWNAAGPLPCATCHAAPPTPGSGNSGARHTAHDNNNAWVPNKCGTCHQANNNKTSMAGYAATHVNGSVEMKAAVPYTPPTCTNICHLVNAATGDWLDSNPLACTDCHSGTYIGTAPTSGLHMTGSAMAHDDLFPASAVPGGTATCTDCHLASGPSSTHKTGSAGAVPPTQNSTETTYSFNTTYIPNVPAGSGYVNTSYPTATTCQATCHSDYRVSTATGSLDTGGLWRRRWVGVENAKPAAANNPGDAVCKNCHGDFTNGWNFDIIDANTSTTDHTNPYNQGTGASNPFNQAPASGDLDRMSSHNVCQTCHGWGYAGYARDWNVAAPGHGDGSITMNGPDATHGTKAGAEYNDTTGGCQAACHFPSFVMNTNSGWPANYGDFGSGACEFCHNGVQTTYPLAPNVMGDGVLAAGDPAHTTPRPFDDGTFGYNVNGHGRDADTSAISKGDPITVECVACHDINVPANTHLDGVLNGRLSPNTRNANSFHLLPGFINASPGNDWAVQMTFDNYCAAAAGCHGGKTTDMRHPKDGGNDTSDPPPIPPYYIVTDPYAVQLGTHASYNVPVVTLPTEMFYDRNLVDAATLGIYDGIPNFALCVTCHNPHGTKITNPRGGTRLSPRPDENNKMMIYWWEDPGVICIRCHT